MLGEAQSARLGALVSEVLGAVLLATPDLLCGSPSLLVDDGQGLGDAFSHDSDTSQLNLRGRRNLRSSQFDELLLEFLEFLLEGILGLLSQGIGLYSFGLEMGHCLFKECFIIKIFIKSYVFIDF